MAKMTVVELESSVVLRYNQTRIEVKSPDLPLDSTATEYHIPCYLRAAVPSVCLMVLP